MKKIMCILAASLFISMTGVETWAVEMLDQNYSVDEVITYFNEVIMDTEYFTGDGDYTVVQKWTEPIYYCLSGEATEKDKEVLVSLCEKLNEIEGFPGIFPEDEEHYANMYMNFWNYDDFYLNMGEFIGYEDADGAIQYWYDTEENYIYLATVGYRTDVDQQVRNSVIQEEIVNSLGITDSWLREDSIVYGGYSETQELSEIDWLIIELLYHPDIKCGMNAGECENIIRTIYDDYAEVAVA